MSWSTAPATQRCQALAKTFLKERELAAMSNEEAMPAWRWGGWWGLRCWWFTAKKKVGLSGDLVRVSSDLVGILGALFFPDFSPPPGIFFPDHPFTMKQASKQASQAGKLGRQASKHAGKQASQPVSQLASKPATQVSQSKQPPCMKASKPGRQQASTWGSKEVSKRASQPTSKQASRPAGHHKSFEPIGDKPSSHPFGKTTNQLWKKQSNPEPTLNKVLNQLQAKSSLTYPNPKRTLKCKLICTKQ